MQGSVLVKNSKGRHGVSDSWSHSGEGHGPSSRWVWADGGLGSWEGTYACQPGNIAVIIFQAEQGSINSTKALFLRFLRYHDSVLF